MVSSQEAGGLGWECGPQQSQLGCCLVSSSLKSLALFLDFGFFQGDDDNRNHTIPIAGGPIPTWG